MENKNEKTEIIETSATVIEEENKENAFKRALAAVGNFFKKFKSDKLKNEALLKRGGYSVAITAVVLVGLIVLNMLVGFLGDRFHLEFDMTSNQKNSMSQDNIDYIKSVKDEVSITIIGAEEDFANYMAYYAQNYYSVAVAASDYEYFEQTVRLISKYGEYSDKLNIKYVDSQSTEFATITSSYPEYNFVHGDIIVESKASGNKRTKILTFSDIYALTEDTSSSYYGYTSYNLASNRIESALTSAISYVTSSDTKKVAVISGHRSDNVSYSAAFVDLLVSNNYDITEIPDKLISEIPSEYDAIIISAPTVDFIGEELDAISEFLDNGGKLGKGLIFFADAASPYLPNLYEFLQQWGIEIGEGIVFETYERNIFDKPTTFGTYPAELEDDDINDKIGGAITNYNVPMNIGEPATTYRKATALMQTLDTTVVAPLDAADDWADYTEDDMKQYATVIQSVESDLDSENNEITSYVMAFSSVEYVQSEFASYVDLSNQDIVMAVTDRASHVGDTSITFTSKVIENESFASEVTAFSVKVVNIIFMFALPVAIVVIGIIVFVRRRNAR